MNLKNKNIIVTGGSDGIGLEIVKKLIDQEANVIVVSRKRDNLGDIKASFYDCDLQDGNQINRTINKIIDDHKNIHCLINNAGVWQNKNIVENISDEEIDQVISTNLTGLIKITKHCLPNLKLQDESIILNISSRSGVVAGENQSVYCASKFGVYGFTEVLKIDLKGTNVKVAGVYQGGIATKFFQKAGDINVPYTTFTNPADLASALVFMLTQPKNIWISDIRIER
ncbi:SDR family oxidoreductase [Candidatus Shapirobacteria bacterium]|nr:SDR family oxidoreductase [Candidatus Shapirobacteria bacterium]